jgi:hypothetical protein
MNEIAPELSGSGFATSPLPVEVVAAAVQKLMGSPTGVKLMAARGIASLRPSDLVVAIYQLSFDADLGVKTAAEAAPGALPDKVIAGPMGESLPPPVIHFFAERLSPTRVAPLERILYNQVAADETFVRLAARCGERELEIIVQNEIRLLRCPAIVSELFLNKQARMSSVNRAIELCARHKVRVEGIPAFDEIARSIIDDPTATDPAVADKAFEAVLQAVEEAAVEEALEDGDGKNDTDEKKSKRKSPIIDFTKLKLHEKIRLATLGNAYCRSNLIRDSNKMVAMAVIRSPLLTDSEVVRAAGNRAISEEVIRYIASQRDFVKLYQVRHSLVFNPKCPLAYSLRFINLLTPDDLKTMARSKNVPSALAVAAKKLVQKRNLNG